MILTLAGVAAGIALSFAAAWLIEQVAPLLTVTISWRWVALAVLLALGGGTIAALYPGWCAARTDVVEALSLE